MRFKEYYIWYYISIEIEQVQSWKQLCAWITLGSQRSWFCLCVEAWVTFVQTRNNGCLQHKIPFLKFKSVIVIVFICNIFNLLIKESNWFVINCFRIELWILSYIYLKAADMFFGVWLDGLSYFIPTWTWNVLSS